ncbi:hypothetical protein G6F43_001039 [Rhizopus delemar]|nr:hypothetical protein G6F43_001039 [Rhizopus delemar]
METTGSTDDEFITITRTINGIDAKTKSIRKAKLDFLLLSARMTDNKIGEVESQSTYYDVFLSEIIADQDRNIALRWEDKPSYEEKSDIPPDAIISTLMQHYFGYPVGFGEFKPSNNSTIKPSLCIDILRLGIASKKAIDKWHFSGFLAFYDQ